ncbi:MAG: glycosyltransferase N-terminal domain-containing protein [Desulfobacterales bacterium]
MSMNRLHKSAFAAYNLAWRIALPWLRFHHRLAEGYPQRTLQELPAQVVDLWIQAASVGESYLALELIKNLKTRTAARILVTTNTRQGIDILYQALPAHLQHQVAVRYFPFDKPSIMEHAADCLRPNLMVLLESEIWPGLLRALKKRHCKIIIVNGRITDRSLRRYCLWPSIWQTLQPDKILAISPADADRFGRLFGPDKVEVMANIKFDRIALSESGAEDHSRLRSILPPGIPFAILASIRRAEEIKVAQIINEIMRIRPQTVIGLFPRHLHRLAFWQDALSCRAVPWTLRSSAFSVVPAGSVILWDTFGELASAYRLAQAAFVGGSLAPLGGQNFLEALVSGVVPVIGPSWQNFAWVGREIVDEGLLRVAADWKKVTALLVKDLETAPSDRAIVEKTLQFVNSRKGGTAQACRQIEAMLHEETLNPAPKTQYPEP